MIGGIVMGVSESIGQTRSGSGWKVKVDKCHVSLMHVGIIQNKTMIAGSLT